MATAIKVVIISSGIRTASIKRTAIYMAAAATSRPVAIPTSWSSHDDGSYLLIMSSLSF
jgi:hypothetical protein